MTLTPVDRPSPVSSSLSLELLLLPSLLPSDCVPGSKLASRDGSWIVEYVCVASDVCVVVDGEVLLSASGDCSGWFSQRVAVSGRSVMELSQL